MIAGIPKIGVLMPVYNVASFVSAAVQSVLNQSYTNFELLIIDDASTDGTFEVISSFKDTRIRIIRNSVNKGLVYSLNLGLDLLPNEFIARMDGDDLCLPDRFSSQLSYLEANSDVVFCGTQAYWDEIDSGGNLIRVHNISYPFSDDELRVSLIWSASFIHPSVMIRNSIIRQNNLKYNHDYPSACEDWYMWIQLLKYGKIANINEKHLRYRVRKNSLHRMDSMKTELLRKNVIVYYLNRIGLNPESSLLIANQSKLHSDSIKELCNCYSELLHVAKGKLNIVILKYEIANQLAQVIRGNNLKIRNLIVVLTRGYFPNFYQVKQLIKFYLF